MMEWICSREIVCDIEEYEGIVRDTRKIVHDSRKKLRGKERLTILSSNNDLQENLEFFDMPRAS